MVARTMSFRRFIKHGTEGHTSQFLKYQSYFPLYLCWLTYYWFSQCNLWQAFNQNYWNFNRNSDTFVSRYVAFNTIWVYGLYEKLVWYSQTWKGMRLNRKLRRTAVAHETLRLNFCYLKQWRIQVKTGEQSTRHNYFSEWQTLASLQQWNIGLVLQL